MKAQLEKIKAQYERLQEQLKDSKIFERPEEAQKLQVESADLRPTVELIERLESTENQIREARELLTNPELKSTAEEEISALEREKVKLEKELKIALIPKDPRDSRNVILEIRGGAGGEESALFAAELFRMYTRYAETKHWHHEIIEANRTGIGGYKEVVLEIRGRNAYGTFKYESGVHRVQRVPETEKSGRIHTSTVTVAVMPISDEDSNIEIKTEDLRIDVYRSSGAGGQHVNKTESAVRLTHLPTGLVVACQAERSQQKNKAKAMSILQARLETLQEEKQQKASSDLRKSQIGTGDRSEKIRTYNFPQDRVTDHRIKLTLPNLPAILEGNLDRLLIPLREADEAKKLELQAKRDEAK